MRVETQDQPEAIYIRLDESGEVAGTREVMPGVNLDYTEDKRIVGIEILYLDKRQRREDLTLALKAYLLREDDQRKAG